MTKVIELSTGQEVDAPDQYAGGALAFLYGTVFGRVVLRLLLRRWVWKVYAWRMKTKSSLRKVQNLASRYDITPQQFVGNGWKSFADFFVRQYKPDGIARTFTSKSPKEAIAVAQAVVSLTTIEDTTTEGAAPISIKGRRYQLADIINDEATAAEYVGGTAVCYHLGVQHYHRYLFPDDGTLQSSRAYPGVLHTVSSLSSAYPVYSINSRVVSVLDTNNAGKVVMVEVGAMMAGKIVNNSLEATQGAYKKGEEKGHFELGGSAILVVYKKGVFVPHATIVAAQKQQKETLVMVGEVIGTYA